MNITKQSSSRNLNVNGASRGTIGGEADLASFFFVLLVLLILISTCDSIKSNNRGKLE
jgi:hypothetical protein